MKQIYGCLVAAVLLLPLLSSSVDVSAQATHLITQRDRQFSRTEMSVKVGDTVIFRNDDSIAHHVVSHTPFFIFDLDLQQPGAENAMVFAKPGTVIVGCDIHPRMEVAVTVVE